MSRIDPRLRAALEETSLPWEVEKGKRHYKVRLAGRMVCVWPFGATDKAPRALQNVMAQIKRMAREIRDGLHK